MMAWLWLDNGSNKLPSSASGFPSPRADCCRWTPNRRISKIPWAGLMADYARVGENILHSGGHQSLIGTIATVGLGIKSP